MGCWCFLAAGPLSHCWELLGHFLWFFESGLPMAATAVWAHTGCSPGEGPAVPRGCLWEAYSRMPG